MKTKRQTKIGTVLYVAVLIATMGWLQQYALADSEPVAAAEGNAQLVEAQAAAKEILMRMAEFMAKIPQYSVNLASNYDVLQESGQMIEFGESRTVILSRLLMWAGLENRTIGGVAESEALCRMRLPWQQGLMSVSSCRAFDQVTPPSVLVATLRCCIFVGRHHRMFNNSEPFVRSMIWHSLVWSLTVPPSCHVLPWSSE